MTEQQRVDEIKRRIVEAKRTRARMQCRLDDAKRADKRADAPLTAGHMIRAMILRESYEAQLESLGDMLRRGG